MTAKHFVQMIEQLGYTTSDAHELLGIARSTVYKIADGTIEVPPVVERLLEMYVRHGVPKALSKR